MKIESWRCAKLGRLAFFISWLFYIPVTGAVGAMLIAQSLPSVYSYTGSAPPIYLSNGLDAWKLFSMVGALKGPFSILGLSVAGILFGGMFLWLVSARLHDIGRGFIRPLCLLVVFNWLSLWMLLFLFLMPGSDKPCHHQRKEVEEVRSQYRKELEEQNAKLRS